MKLANRPSLHPSKKKAPLTDPKKKKPKISPLNTSPKNKTQTPKHLLLSEPQSPPAETSPNSPLIFKKTINSVPSSPHQKSAPKIQHILKKSLKRFKKEKIELKKAKEFAENWQALRKKKLDQLNQQTRLENKKSKTKTSRPKTALGSPEHFEANRRSKKRVLHLSFERKAIGLELQNLRSSTPRAFTLPKNEGKFLKNLEKNKKILENFIRKKRKERSRKARVLKEQKPGIENRKTKAFLKPEKKAKNLLKKQFKGRPSRPKNMFLIPTKKPENKNAGPQSQFFLDKDSGVFESLEKQGRESCLNKPSNSLKEASEKSQKINSKIPSEELLKVISASVPAEEIKSTSNNSSSDKTEKLMVKKKKSQDDIKKNKGALIIIDFVLKKLKEIFLIAKTNDLALIDTPQLSELPNLPFPEKSIQKGPLESTLGQLINKNSREPSEDLDKIWEKIEFNSKTLSYLNNPELAPLTPIEDSQKNSKIGSKKPSEEISASIFDQLKKVVFPSIETLSFGNLGEISYEELVESPLLMSINSQDSFESSEDLITLGPLNRPLDPVLSQPEPGKPIFFNIKILKENPILIDDGSSSLSDYLAIAKENSSVATPEAEEIEDFSSIISEISVKKHLKSDTFNLSEETLLLEEEEIIEKTLILLEIFIYQHLLDSQFVEEAKKTNFQLLGNPLVLLHEVCVRTGSSFVLSFGEKLWRKADKDEILSNILNWKVHFYNLGIIQGRNDQLFDIIPVKVLEETEKDETNSFYLSSSDGPNEFEKAHNRMVFECLNFFLKEIQKFFNPPPWNFAGVVKYIDSEFVAEKVLQSLKKFSRIFAGKIPGIDMIGDNGELDCEMLQRIREDGLAAMLAGDIFEDEKVWVDYRVEESEYLLDLADFIFDGLLVEVREVL